MPGTSRAFFVAIAAIVDSDRQRRAVHQRREDYRVLKSQSVTAQSPFPWVPSGIRFGYLSNKNLRQQAFVLRHDQTGKKEGQLNFGYWVSIAAVNTVAPSPRTKAQGIGHRLKITTDTDLTKGR
ncbi:hypothetical protein [Vibrio vulnificus]|uniref:hypothetical protein n=1 Tax=Vibrio vulnificus TaxID=672 RepID=UPI001EEA3035|nr:hypothetical protein [Vibrio vulnificus]MCG6288870.1 hypothetical protein [Vibrio vulnificus]